MSFLLGNKKRFLNKIMNSSKIDVLPIINSRHSKRVIIIE